jgi:hypothetical protein
MQLSSLWMEPGAAAIPRCLKVWAGVHRIVYRDYGRLLSRVFPYGVFYTMDDEGAVAARDFAMSRHFWESMTPEPQH